MMTPARVQYRNRLLLRNTIRWVGVYVAWLLIVLLITAVFGVDTTENLYVILFIYYVILSIGVGFVTVTLTLERWVAAPPSVKCPQCSGTIVPNDPWMCGHCDRINEIQPLVARCDHCGEAPKSVVCPRDEYVIQLDRQPSSDNNHAKPVGSSTEITESSPIDEILQEKARLEAEKQAIDADTGRLQALAIRKQAEQQLNADNSASVYARFKELLNLQLELPDARHRIAQELATKYADDPDSLKSAMDNLDAVEEQIKDGGISN